MKFGQKETSLSIGQLWKILPALLLPISESMVSLNDIPSLPFSVRANHDSCLLLLSPNPSSSSLQNPQDFTSVAMSRQDDHEHSQLRCPLWPYHGGIAVRTGGRCVPLCITPRERRLGAQIKLDFLTDGIT